MKLRHPGLIGLIALLATWLIRCWIATLRFRLVFLDGKQHPTDARWDRYIYAFWHETILFPLAFKGRGHVLISQHTDGELIARVCRHLRVGVVRGSSRRGGLGGLMGMAQKSGVSHLLITPDGPRGPRRRAQMGVVLLASLTGLPIVPLGLTFAPAWRVRSWDRMLLPMPWGAAYGVVGEPMHIPAEMERHEYEACLLRVEEEMTSLTQTAERWAQSGIYPTRLSATALIRRSAA
jgi:lysophospholipid acyltransferase (LPLAT)-like uncharacterized protein